MTWETVAKCWLILCAVAIIAGLIILAVLFSAARWAIGGTFIVVMTIWSATVLGFFEDW